MAINYKCILAYGLTEEELDKIKKRRLKVKEITEKEYESVVVENGFEKLPTWQDATDRYCQELSKNNPVLRKSKKN